MELYPSSEQTSNSLLFTGIESISPFSLSLFLTISIVHHKSINITTIIIIIFSSCFFLPYFVSMLLTTLPFTNTVLIGRYLLNSIIKDFISQILKATIISKLYYKFMGYNRIITNDHITNRFNC